MPKPDEPKPISQRAEAVVDLQLPVDNAPDLPPLTISGSLAQRVKEATGQNVYLCYQCVKCTSGCPVSDYFDWQPNQIMRALQLGQEDIALKAETPWLCACCQTCSTRCPQGLDVAAIMEFLASEATARGIKPAIPALNVFNQAFMRQVRLWGRAYEVGLIAEMNVRSGKLLNNADLGARMVRKHKVAFLPSVARPPRRAKPVPGAAGAVAYYPGCSLHSTAVEFNISSQAVCEALDIKLFEPPGWLCCGSSAAHRSDPEAAFQLPMRNLALVEQSGFNEVVMPCAACFNRHRAALHELRQEDDHKAELAARLAYDYEDTVRVTTLADAILEHAGAEKVAEQVQRPLAGMRVVCYYGCLLTRPPQVTGAPHPENPMELDDLMTALGAEVLDWSYKTTCCGATHSLIRPDIVLKLSGDLLRHAREAGADAVVLACPLCHTNLDARQFQMTLAEPMPVFYFTQLMAVALGLPAKAAALDKNLVDPRPLLRQKEIIV
jgi:heterodisulfide reductase subunit B2